MQQHTWSRFRAVGLVLLAALGGASGALAATIHVPSERPHIQDGLNMAQPGDTVLVAPGTYYENLFMPDEVVLLGDQGMMVTIVDGQLAGPVVVCPSVSGFTIEGFTLRNGWSGTGSGVEVYHSQGRILHCRVTGNQASGDGGGIGIVTSVVEIRHCTITENHANVLNALDGGGIFAYGSSTVVIEDCYIADNRAHEGGGIAIVGSTVASIRGCTIASNESTSPGHSGGAIMVDNSVATVQNNTIVGNITPFTGASLMFDAASGICERNIVVNSPGIGLWCTGGTFTACNNIWNSQNQNRVGCPPGPTAINFDPQFCDLPNLDLRLHDSSPCAPANSPSGCGLIGAFDVGCGPVAVESSTWGAIKAQYR